MRKPQDAFTLVELLLAATLTAIILGSAFVSLSIVMKAYKELSSKTNQAEIARLILDRMRIDLESTFYSPHEDLTRFVGYDQIAGELSVDSLTFISAVNRPVDTGGGTSDLAEIQYYVDMDESTPERWLLRRMDNTPDSDPFTGGQVALLGPQVQSLDFQFFDGTMWWPEWDSTEDIPLAVNVTIGLFEAGEMGEMANIDNVKTFSTTIWLANYRVSANAQSENGTSGSDSNRPGNTN